ncbi:hypothetical protein BECAL_02306 [Bellilinea caldifistulae]|uniref:Uncharacterized protein n=1 Tax=Bellilinea caldifistulae TaxID=360411 RepID=A0A0P6XX49_9CHLR|nr:hypothetical protein [Bellilinea caldifistulae]KPL73840.1 hypothetical protein AC812_13705 [Bellilinea caldifistulae]GAP11121.1 hypothetical protein BECAL_02306 [Bellilinea caldifistulae]
MTERIYSDTRPYDGGRADEYGRLIELGKEHYDRVEHHFTHIRAGEVLEVVTSRSYWGPDGYEAPGRVWRVTWDGEGEAKIEYVREAEYSDYPRGHSVHRARGHKCEICQ